MSRVPMVTHTDLARIPPSPTSALTHSVEGIEVRHEYECQGVITLHFDVPGDPRGIRLALSPSAARTLNNGLRKALREFLEI